MMTGGSAEAVVAFGAKTARRCCRSIIIVSIVPLIEAIERGRNKVGNSHGLDSPLLRYSESTVGVVAVDRCGRHGAVRGKKLF